MKKAMWAIALVGVVTMGLLTNGIAHADGTCKDNEARIADLEKRMAQMEAIIKQTPLPKNMFRTSTGAVFEIVEKEGFGRAIKAPDGTIWSAYQGDFGNAKGTIKDGIITDTAATRACDKIGGTLPTKQNFEMLRNYFELGDNGILTDQGRKDLYKVFPDMRDRFFWSSSVNPYDTGLACDFNGYYGGISYGFRYVTYSVRCVAR